MILTVVNNPNTTDIVIEENIKSIVDNEKIKNAIEESSNLDATKPIDIRIKDSFIITSSVIGCLIKFIKKDKIKISVYVYNKELYTMLDDMNLIQTLNVKKENK